MSTPSFEPTATAQAIESLLYPRSIAFIGASSDPTKQSGQPLRNTVAGGYEGKLFVVNRRGEPVDNVPTYKTIAEIPQPIDTAFVTVPAEQCPDVVAALGEKGARTAIVAVGGFAETGSATGARLSEALRAQAHKSGVRLVGPVCNGIYNTAARLALGYNAIHQRTLAPGSVAFISHSGALAGPFCTLLQAAGGGISAFVSAGSEIDIGLADFIAYFAADSRTRVIALILDHVGDGQKFLAAVRKARRAGKEIVALKLGDTPLGRAATLAHSSHLSGEKAVYEAEFGSEGIRAVPSVECLAIVAALLASGRYRAAGGVMGTSSSGGGAIMLADLLTREQVPVTTLAPATLAAMGSRLRFDAARIMNPFDLGLGGRAHYVANVLSLAGDPAAAALIVFGTPVPQLQSAAQHAQLAMATVAAIQAHADLPVIYLSPAPLFDDERRILAEGRIPICGSTLDAVAIVKALLPVTPAIAAESVMPHAAAERRADYSGPLSEHRSKATLRARGLAFPDELLVTTLEDAVAAAKTIGYPVVVKVSGDGIWHKSERRLLELGIDSETALRAAWQRLQARAGAFTDIVVEGFLVAKAVTDGVEVFLGFSRDPEFGPIAILGPGGIQAELFGTAAMRHLPLPLNRDRVDEAIASSVLARLFAGHRSGEAGDQPAFVELVLEAARIVGELGAGLRELDLNPVKVRPLGLGAWPLDALCVFDRP